MTSREVSEVLWAVAADLQWVADRLWSSDGVEDPVVLLAGVTRTGDEFSSDVAAVHAAISPVVARLTDREATVVRLLPD